MTKRNYWRCKQLGGHSWELGFWHAGRQLNRAVHRVRRFSPQHLQLVRIRMDNCRQNHSLCNTTRRNRQLPKRVLDISALPVVRLYESRLGETAPYATLSYCWGK